MNVTDERFNAALLLGVGGGLVKVLAGCMNSLAAIGLSDLYSTSQMLN